MVKTWKSACIAAACTLATAAQAAAMASVTGSCGKHVGGALDDIPSFTGCPGGFWADSRPGARSTGSWSGTAQVGALGASASIAIDTTPPLGQTLPLALASAASAASATMCCSARLAWLVRRASCVSAWRWTAAWPLPMSARMRLPVPRGN